MDITYKELVEDKPEQPGHSSLMREVNKMVKSEDEKRFYETGAAYVVYVPRKNSWQSEPRYCETKEQANKLANKHGVRSFFQLVPFRQEINAYPDEENTE